MGKSRASAPIAQERVQRSSKRKPRDVQRRTRGSASLPAPDEEGQVKCSKVMCFNYHLISFIFEEPDI
jgi:hypothetical protein